MNGIVIVSRFWTRLFSAKQARAITIFPFIFLLDRQDKKDLVLLNHERIHLVQALELLIIPFYILYIAEFLIRYLVKKDFMQAYQAVSFEREAFDNENDFNYLRKRNPWSFRKYMYINAKP